MFSYRYSFYVGNYVDVFKYIVQSLIIESLKEKDKLFFYFDIYVGVGCYQLGSEYVECIGEYFEGIVCIWQQDDLFVELEVYINVVKYFNCSGQLCYYFGLLLIVCQLLCEQDSL